MKNKATTIAIFLLTTLLALPSLAQDRVIHGRVFTFDSIPLIDANVKVKSTKQVVKTDTTGWFTVAVNQGDKIIFSAKGFNTEKVRLDDKIKAIVVNLRLKPGQRNREYAIGYGHVSDANKLNAVESLNNDDVDFSQYSNIYDLIRGRFAGVQIVNGEIIIRGVNSINSSSAALIVLDGVPVSESMLNSIPPVQVKSVNVIKDGSSAIYGSRGANGVIIIETKKGTDN